MLTLSAGAGVAAAVAALGQLHYYDAVLPQAVFDALCFRVLRGWMEPTVQDNYFQLRPEYIPGDIDFDPLGLKPADPEEFKEMKTKYCRLAMLAAAGMIVQELQTGAKS
jgi:hypothetical protein